MIHCIVLTQTTDKYLASYVSF